MPLFKQTTDILFLVQAPGHDVLMATMLNGAAVMDAALLLIAANEPCPQPQTSEHLAAVEIMKLKDIIILQNKVDLIREAAAEEHWNSIVKFVKGSVADGATHCPRLCATQVQHRCSQRVHCQEGSHSHSRLFILTSTHCHSVF